MSYYDFFNLDTHPQYPSHHGLQYGQSFLSSADVRTSEQGEYSMIPEPAPIDFLNWDDFFLTSFIPTNSVAQASANLPLYNNLSGTLPYSCLDIVANSSRALPVAAPVPVPHATRTKTALRTMMSFGDKDKGDVLDHSASGELLKIADARTQIYLNNDVVRPNVQAAMDYNVFANSRNSKQTTERAKLVIRPISPSTLMALTEPCLMAWCTAFDEILAEPDSSAYFPLQSLDYNNYVDTESSPVYNAWGY